MKKLTAYGRFSSPEHLQKMQGMGWVALQHEKKRLKDLDIARSKKKKRA